jgi:hypothetical protein
MKTNSQPCQDDVLYNFAMESEPNLKQWLLDFPQYAAELIDLFHELSRNECEDQTPLSDRNHELINRAWKRHIQEN